jgi:hypothetical protein
MRCQREINTEANTYTYPFERTSREAISGTNQGRGG